RGDRRGLHAAGKVDRRQDVADRCSRRSIGADIDGGVAVAIGDEVAAHARAARNSGRSRSRTSTEGDGLAVHRQRVAIGGGRGELGGGGGAEQGDRTGQGGRAVG